MNLVRSDIQLMPVDTQISLIEKKTESPKFYEPDDQETLAALALSDNRSFIDLNRNH